MSDRERQVKDEAYRLWDAAGRPEGRDDHYWFEAEKRVAADDAEPAPAAEKAKTSKAAIPVVKNAANSGVVAPVAVEEPRTETKKSAPKEPRLTKGDKVDIVPARAQKPQADKPRATSGASKSKA